MTTIEIGVSQATGDRLGVLSGLLTRLAAEGRRRVDVLEVGSYEGQSTLYFNHSISDMFPDGGSVTCVDPWAPYHSPEQLVAGLVYENMDADLRSGVVFERFKKNIQKANPRVPIGYFRGTLAQAMMLMLTGCWFDVVYLDGDHRYTSVREDIANAKRLVRVGGLICGDDLEAQLDESAVERARELVEVDYQDDYHPGVSLAVHEAFGRVWCENSVWAMKRTLNGWSAEL